MNNEQPAIDVQSSTAVAVREEQPQGIQRFDVRAAQIAIENVVNRAAVVGEVMVKVMKEGVHYGKIPGTDKNVLLKAGAEKLSAVFNLIPQFVVHQTDYQNNHREYRITCRLSNGTEGVGTCTTLEEKYRYRKASRRCPKCGKETIIEGKAEYGGGWLCWAKKGGCGAKFEIAEPAIAQQSSGKVEHPNPADYWNTCLKMAKKRAHVDAIITATSTSDLLTQDVEEMQEMAEQASAAVDGKAEPDKKAEPKKATAKKKETASSAPLGVKSDLSKEEFDKLWAFMEAGKAKFLLMANDEVTTPFAWAWAVRNGKILETEKLEAITATKLFPSCSLNAMIPANQPFMKADYMEAVEEITAIGKAGPLGNVERIAYEKAYGLLKKEAAKKAPAKASEVPRDIEAEWKSIQIPGWSKHVKELGFKTFGDLPKKYLWWWCCKWEPQGKPPKQADIELRKVLDFVKDNYDFESKEDDGSAPGSAEPAPSEPFRDDSDVPF